MSCIGNWQNLPVLGNNKQGDDSNSADVEFNLPMHRRLESFDDSFCPKIE